MQARKSIAMVAVAVLAGGFVSTGAASSAQAYPAGVGLTLNVRAVDTLNRIELVVRHAVPGAPVQAVFERVVKSRPANALGVAVFSYLRPPTGVHVAVATSNGDRASARQYSETFHLGIYAAYAGSRNWVELRNSKPGTMMMVSVAGRMYSVVVGPNYVARVNFIVPVRGSYSIKVFCNGELERVYTAISR